MAPAADAEGNASKGGAVEEPQLSGEQEASLASRVLFSWVSPLVARGHRLKLQLDELFELWPEDRAEALAAADAAFCARSASTPTLHARLLHATRRHLLQASCCRLLYCAAQLASPMLLRHLVMSVALEESVGLGIQWGACAPLACACIFRCFPSFPCVRRLVLTCLRVLQRSYSPASQ